MAAAIPLRDDFDGGRRSEAAALGGVGLQIIRDWVLRFNAEGPEGLIDRKPPGASPKLNDAQRRTLCAIVESGPMCSGSGKSSGSAWTRAR
jgi:transposase